MPLPFEGDPALLGQLLVGVSEVDQERRRRQDRKQERSLLVAVPAVFGTLQRIENIMGDPMQPNIAEECCKKNSAFGSHPSCMSCSPSAGLRFFSQPTSLTVNKTRPSGWVGMGFGVYLAAQVGGWVWGLGFSVLNYQRRGKSRPCARVAQRRPCVSQRATKPPLVVPLNKGM